MPLEVKTKREFVFGDNKLVDPDPSMSVREVIKFYSAQYPELA